MKYRPPAGQRDGGSKTPEANQPGREGRTRMKIRNIFGNRYRGAMGKDFVASSWKGHDYVKVYTPPRNPRSPLQTEHRTTFSQGSKAWGPLTRRQQAFYNAIVAGTSERMSGQNLWVSRYIDAVKNGRTPETPMEVSWRTEDGNPVGDGWLIVRKGSWPLFTESLRDARVEVALTRSDAPYAFVLRRGTQEDVVLTMKDILETDSLGVLESTLLGIKLVVNVEAPKPKTALRSS